MHARELVELAALASAHGPVLVRSVERISASGVEQYWTASKCRLDRWTRSLKSFATEAANPTARRIQWPFVRAVVEEVLTGEMLTRVWAAVLCAVDRRHSSDHGEPIARSVLIGHLEARHRALMFLVQGPGIDPDAAVQLNHLRRRAERWTDVLIGYLLGLAEVSEFAVEPKRAQEFSADLRYQHQGSAGKWAWPLLHASVLAAFHRCLSPFSPNADLNARIAAGILACFPSELFDSTGLLRSLWLQRLTNITNDAQGMIDQLLATDEPVASEARGGMRRTRRFGR